MSAPHRLPVVGGNGRGRRVLVGEVIGARECPRRGVRITVRGWTEDGPFPYPSRVEPAAVRLTGKQREQLLATDDHGALLRPGNVAHALTRMGLAEPHNIGWRLTTAGRAVVAHLRSEHRTRVSELGTGRGFNMARNRWEHPRDRYAWVCSCGAGVRLVGAEEARQSARRHRETGWVPLVTSAGAKPAAAARRATGQE